MPFISLLSASLCLIVGFFVYSKGKEKPVNRHFLIINIFIFIWNSGDFIVPLFGDHITQGLFYDRFSQVGGILITPWFIIFIRTLTGHRLKEISKLISFRLFAILAVGLLCLLPTPLLIKEIEVLPFKEVPGIFLFVEIGAFVTNIIFGLGHVLKARKTASPAQKIRLSYFVTAILVGILCAIAWFVVISFLPGLSTNFIYAFEVTYVLLTAYAILRYKLMNIDIIFKRTVVYTVLSTFVIGAYVAIILAFEVLSRSITGYSSLAVKIVAAFIITATFQPMRTLIDKSIDKAFFRGKYDYQEALAQFARSLGSVLDLRELVNLIVSIGGILRAKNLAFMLRDEQLGRYKVKSSTGLTPEAQAVGFDDFSDLIRLLNAVKKVVPAKEVERWQASGMYPNLRGELDILRAEVIIPVFVKNELNGILFVGEKLSEESYDRNDFNLLATLADEAGIAFENAKLYGDIKRTYFETVQALAQAIEASDEYTRGHSDRVTKIAVEIAKQLELSRDKIDTLKFAGILHDIGKIGVIKEVLHKPGKLSDLEFALIKMHPKLGEEIIKPVAFLEKVRPIIRHHHERFDGNGYPDGLHGDFIPFMSRILAVADTYDAMTSHRPYRSALSADIARAEIKKCSGTQFDPVVVQAFLEIAGATL
ncbi:MAG: HD domain-containing protein [Candidatus Aminicenantes bacterium]|nr:HD domain-containing protein [Candidatus Aminicenantes bacterium]